MSLKCNVQRNDLIEGLGSLQNITSKRGTLAVLSNILIEATSNGLVLTGTDLEVGLRLFVPAEIESMGSLTLPSKKIFEILRSLFRRDYRYSLQRLSLPNCCWSPPELCLRTLIREQFRISF